MTGSVKIRHPFPFEPGRWKAKGMFMADGREVSARGEALVTHETNLWINESSMELELDPPVTMANRYEIEPFKKDAASTSWVSANPAIGTLVGHFHLVGDTIVSRFQTTDRSHKGSEFMILVGEGRYLSRGVFIRGDSLESAWAMELVRA